MRKYLTAVSAIMLILFASLCLANRAELAQAAVVSANFFNVLGRLKAQISIAEARAGMNLAASVFRFRFGF